VLLYLEFSSDKMDDQSGGDRAAINDLELAGFSQGGQRELVPMRDKGFVYERISCYSHDRLGREWVSQLESHKRVGMLRQDDSLPLDPPPNPYPKVEN